MRKRTKYMLFYVFILLVLLMITNGYSYAKYISNSVWNYYLDSKAFYFSSDSLDTIQVKNINNNWNFDSTYFTIKNSLNDFLITEYDISYKVNCTIKGDEADYLKCSLNGTNSSSFDGVLSASAKCVNNIDDIDVSGYNRDDCESFGYEWLIQENFKELYFDVVQTGTEEISDVSVLIEVTTLSPYKKTMLGEFNLSVGSFDAVGLMISYNEFDDYSRVVISNSYDVAKCVKLTWDSNVFRIDDRDDLILSSQIGENGYINQVNFNVDKKDSVSFIFYRTDFTKNYSHQDFSLVESTDC